ncbi:MAG: type ISP restriction/modification enzyme [Gelidibacter sp.]|uniref:type ISP restriction/modification enzyme n=1 Tax=Gelidibacter sp. TaxID=2018083 RepID=UPI0032641E88
MENENQSAQNTVTFSVTKDALYPNFKIGNSIPKDSTADQTALNTSESSAGIDLEAIKKIEEKLKLTFLSEKDAENHVCMANNPEVRDEFKDIFDIKDLLDFSYAVLHSPSYLEKYKEVSKMDCFQIPYPNDSYHFWKLVNLGTKLRDLNLREAPSDETHNHEAVEILKRIAEIKVE